jgi:hypothetical protein
MCPWPASPGPYLYVARSRGSGRVWYRSIVYDVLQYNFLIRLWLYFNFYLGPIVLWTSTQTNLRGVNTMGIGSHTLVSSPHDSIWIADSSRISNLRLIYNLRPRSIFNFFTCNFYQYFIFSHFHEDFGERAWCFRWIKNQLIAWANTHYLLQIWVPGLKFWT